MMRASFLFLVVVLVAACPDGAGAGAGAGGGEGEGEGQGVVEDMVLEETPIAVPIDADLNAGFALATRADGRFAFIFASPQDPSRTVTCRTFGGTTPPPAPVQDMTVIDEQLDGSLRTQVIDTVPPLYPDSVAMTTDPTTDGLVVAYTGGGIANGYCGASDLLVGVEDPATGAYTITTIATDSNAGTPPLNVSGSQGPGSCRTLQQVCAQGDSVGRNPFIATNGDASAWALAYNDMHFGFGADDIFGSDLELGLGTSSTGYGIQTLCGDAGAGYLASAAVTTDGRTIAGHAVIASNNLDNGQGGAAILHKGIYTETEQTDGTFVEVDQFEQGSTSGRVTVGHRDGLGFFVAFRDDGTQQLVAFRSVDDGVTWGADVGNIVEDSGVTGNNPKLGFLSDDTIVIAYGHCKDVDDGGGCNNTRQDGVRVAWSSPGASGWQKKTFKGDDEDVDGVKTDMVITPDDVITTFEFNSSQGNATIHRMRKTTTP